MEERDLYYEIVEDGYHIYDRNDDKFHIHQYEPYIPDHSKSYEENAQAQIEELLAPVEFDPTLDPAYQAGYEQALLDLAEEAE